MIAIASLALTPAFLRGDDGPPVCVRLPRDAGQATAGEAYSGVFEIEIAAPGAVSGIELSGDGWQILTAETPEDEVQAEAGVLLVPFQAIPTDPDRPITMTLVYEGRRVSRSYRLGPDAFQYADADRPSAQVAPAAIAPAPEPEKATEEDGSPEGGAITLRFTGRIVYLRPSGFDINGNPILVDGTYEGVDNIWVEIMDEDDIVDETIWSGFTNAAGYFDTGDISWDDCDATGCDDPDIYIRWECDTPVVNVQEPIPLEPDYSWSNVNNVIDDFTGSAHDFGTHTPLDINDMPALHIHNSIVRAHRFVQTRSGTGIDTNEVDVLWPDGDNASHVGFLDELYISHRREWQEDVHTHEFGHHFLDEYAVAPGSDYCNDLCDTDPTFPVFDCGHCKWCRETDHDALNEGWPNWLGYFVTNDYPNLYVFSDGTPYVALRSDSDEALESCDDVVPEARHDPFLTEGFVGALLNDISDPNVDADGNLFFEEHDNDGDGAVDVDGITDCLDLGADEIFDVMLNDLPVTVTEFLIAFQNRYPEHRSRLWSTAFNVHSDYVGGGIFPADTQPPGAVQPEDVSSITHPLGVGGPSPCIEVLVGGAPDDVTGACGYSYEWSQIPGGVEPPADENGNFIAGSCVTIISHAQSFGNHYLSIRAKDCADRWSNEWATFGPFTLTECNDNGVVDVCEVAPIYESVSCNAKWFADLGLLSCTPHPSFCGTLFPTQCGTKPDCQPNAVPDECDIADGTSEDCNRDGIPDECQDMARWIAPGGGSWHDSTNWEGGGFGGGVPGSGQHVCIDVPGADVTITYDGGLTDIASLACHENLVLDDGNGPPSINLTVQNPSFVVGDLSVGGRDDTTLRNNATLTISGLFTVIPGRCWLRGPGDIIANGGLNITSRATLFESKDLYLANNSTSTSTSLVVLNSGTSTQIEAGSTFEYHGDAGPFSGGNGLLVIDGTFIRATGNGDAFIQSPIANSGLIHNQSGELVLFNGGTHSGDVLSDPGTILGLRSATELLPGSCLIADDVDLLSGSNSLIRGSVDIAGTLKVDGGTWTFTDEADVTSYGQDLFVRTGNAHFQAPTTGPTVDFDSVTVGETGVSGGVGSWFDTGQTVTINTFLLAKGNINGADPITINDLCTWNSGGMNVGGDVLCNAPMTVLSTGGTRSLFRAFNNAAYATFFSSIGPSGAGRFHNLATGTVELKGDGNGLSSGSSTNAGLIVKTTGTGRSTISGVDNSGLIHVQTGELYMSGGGVNTGDILADPGTLLTFNGAHEMQIGSSLTAENVDCFSSTSNVHGNVNITGTLIHDGGTWTFANDATVTSYGHTLFVRSGNIHFDAPVTSPLLVFDSVTVGEAGISGGIVSWFDTGQAVSITTLTLQKGNLSGADPVTINDAFTWGTGGGSMTAGGAVTCNAPSTIQATSSQRTLSRIFNNYGYANFLGSIGPSGAGKYNNMPGGTIDIPGDHRAFGGGSVDNAGVIVKSTGAGTASFSSTDLTTSGTVDIRSGVLEFSNADYIQTAGQTILNGGDLEMFFGTFPVQLQGGKLTGAGTVFGDVQNPGGSVEPGLPVGRLTVDETYIHGTNATLAVTLGGLAPGTLHDQLVVNDTADLQGGTLIVEATGGFVPQPGQRFVILTAANGVSGMFTTVPPEEEYTVIYNPNDVTLMVPPPAVPAVSPWAQTLLASAILIGGIAWVRRRFNAAATLR